MAASADGNRYNSRGASWWGAKECPMKHPVRLLAVAASVATFATAAGPLKRDFESDAVGAPPAGFEFARTGNGAEGKWVVRIEKRADKNHVLVQESADATDCRFPVAVLEDGAYEDVTLSVRARPLSGEVDEAFGLVWRFTEFDDFTVDGR
jgi:hypothetical protein